MSRTETIRAVLVDIYGRGSMAEDLAADLNDRWDAWVASEGDAEDRGLEYAVHMQVWNWFAGGGTAEIAAKRIVAAVNS